MKNALGGDMVEFRFEKGTPDAVEQAITTVHALPFVTELRTVNECDYQAVVTNGESAVPNIFEALSKQPVRIGAITMKRPSLDDVFLHYTGRELRQTGGGGDEAMRARIIMRRTRG